MSLNLMINKFIIKNKDKLWPTVVWQGTKLVVYYLDDLTEDVKISETRGIDFEELLLHVDRGGSVFITSHQKNNLLLKEMEAKDAALVMNTK